MQCNAVNSEITSYWVVAIFVNSSQFSWLLSVEESV